MNTYSLILNGTVFGYYRSYAPYVSARKIFRSLTKNKNALNCFEFEIINVATKVIYKYYGERISANSRKRFVKNGEIREFICRYKYKVKRIY